MGRASAAMRTSRLCVNRVLKHLFYTSGEHYWEAISTSDLRVVGAAPSETFDGETLSGPLGCWTGGAVGYASYGAIVAGGVELCRVEPFAEGDCVGVLLDLNTKSIQFFRNGTVVRRQGDTGSRILKLHVDETLNDELPPISFTVPAMFAAVTLTSTTDQVDVVSMAVPSCYRNAQV